MFGIENYTGFIIAAVVLNLTPGTDTFYVLTRCVAQGRQAGLVSVAGIMTGCVVHVLFTAFGLSVILSTSVVAFNLIKWTGALYQFIHTHKASGPVPFLMLGATFLCTSTIWLLILAGAAGRMTKTLRENPMIENYLQKISGMVFITFGLKLAFDAK